MISGRIRTYNYYNHFSEILLPPFLHLTNTIFFRCVETKSLDLRSPEKLGQKYSLPRL